MQGIPLEKAYSLVYMTEKDLEKVSKDRKFIKELRDILIQLQFNRLKSYNDKVTLEGKPGDDLKRLSNMAPEIFDASTTTTNNVQEMNITINRVRGKQ